MNDYLKDGFFDGFFAGPRAARRHKAGTSRTDAKMHQLKDGFFDGFFAGPRAAR